MSEIIDIKKVEKELMDIKLYPEFLFRDRSWVSEIFLDSEAQNSDRFLLKREFSALRDVVQRQLKTTRFYLYDFMAPPFKAIPEETFFKLELSWEKFDYIQRNLVNSFYMFDESRKWGLVASGEGYWVVGGNEQIIEPLRFELGGKEYIRSNVSQQINKNSSLEFKQFLEENYRRDSLSTKSESPL